LGHDQYVQGKEAGGPGPFQSSDFSFEDLFGGRGPFDVRIISSFEFF